MLDQLFSQGDNYIPYSLRGAGPDLLLLHGFGEDHTCWEYLETRLKEHQRVLLPDLPGTGNARLKETQQSLEDLADSIAALLDYLNIEQTTIIGHSMGGYIALAFAAKYPGKLSGLGLFHSSAYADSAEKKQTRLKSIEFIQKNGSLAFFKQATPALFSDAYRSKHPAIIEDCIRMAAKIPEEAVIRYTRMMLARPDRTELLKQIQVPVLFIIGKLDQAVPYRDSLSQSYLPATSSVEILPEVAHMGMFEASAITLKTIVAFLEINSLISKNRVS